MPRTQKMQFTSFSGNVYYEIYDIATGAVIDNNVYSDSDISIDDINHVVHFNIEGLFSEYSDVAIIYIGDMNNNSVSFINDWDNIAERFFYYDLQAIMDYFGIQSTPSVPALPSLDGDGCEFVDGDILSVVGRDYPMIVVRSSRVLVADNSYTVVYDLIAESGAKVSAPENLVSRYTLPVTTP